MKGFFGELQHSRPMQIALIASLAWHLIWLFVFFIDMNGPTGKVKLAPKIYFVGPILSDDAFNMILATKPEFSLTTYRSDPSVSQSLEPQPQEMDRPEPGDLVSVPLGRFTWPSLRGQLKDKKPYPKTLFQKKFSVDIIRKPFPVEGSLKNRELLTLPVTPLLAEHGDGNWIDPEYELSVAADGTVREARLTISSGDLPSDRTFERYLMQWQFMPLDDPKSAALQTGKVRITMPEKQS